MIESILMMMVSSFLGYSIHLQMGITEQLVSVRERLAALESKVENSTND